MILNLLPPTQILHIDIDSTEINKNIKVGYQIIGDVKQVLKLINEQLPQQAHPDWIQQIVAWKAEYPLKAKSCGKGALIGVIVEFVLGFVMGIIMALAGAALYAAAPIFLL